MSREFCSGTCLLTRREGWTAKRRPVTGGGTFSPGLLAVADGGQATATAAAGATDFEDPLGVERAPAAVIEGAEEEAAAPKAKKKASPRKKVREEHDL